MLPVAQGSRLIGLVQTHKKVKYICIWIFTSKLSSSLSWNAILKLNYLILKYFYDIVYTLICSLFISCWCFSWKLTLQIWYNHMVQICRHHKVSLHHIMPPVSEGYPIETAICILIHTILSVTGNISKILKKCFLGTTNKSCRDICLACSVTKELMTCFNLLGSTKETLL